jgi:methylaspartate mutase epsilon subunit
VASLRELAHEYFHRAGYDDYDLTIVFHQWMGGFPEDEAKAFSVINLGAVVAAMAKAEKIIVKTPHEAMGIPTKEANAAGLKSTRQILSMVEEQKVCGDNASVRDEIALIGREVACLMKAVEAGGEGDLARGAVRAFAAGLLDVPFAPSAFNRGKVLPIRDNEGFIRIYAKGFLPLDPEIMAVHKARLEERAKAEGRATSFQMVTDDIYAISKGKLIGRPK